MTELVQHGLHPPLVIGEVAQHPHVPHAVHVDAESVLILALAGIEVAAAQHRLHVQADAAVIVNSQLFQITALVVTVEVHWIQVRCLLEEAPLIVPGPQIRH